MERYWDKSVLERARLTEEQVNALLEVELMEKGIVTIDQPQMLEVEEIEVARTTYFDVRNGTSSWSRSTGVLFRTIEDAMACIALHPVESGYDYNVGEEYRYAKPLDELHVVPVQLCEKSSIVCVQAQLEKRRANQRVNEEAQRKFRDDQKKVSEACAGVWDDYRDAKALLAEYNQVADTWLEYLKLTEGNKTMAGTFLLRAFDKEKVRAACDELTSLGDLRTLIDMGTLTDTVVGETGE